MFVSKKDENSSIWVLERPIIIFYDGGKVEDPKQGLPLVIPTIIMNFYVSWDLIDGGSSFNIMHSNIFKKVELKKEKLWPYERSDMQALNKTITYLWRYI